MKGWCEELWCVATLESGVEIQRHWHPYTINLPLRANLGGCTVLQSKNAPASPPWRALERSTGLTTAVLKDSWFKKQHRRRVKQPSGLLLWSYDEHGEITDTEISAHLTPEIIKALPDGLDLDALEKSFWYWRRNNRWAKSPFLLLNERKGRKSVRYGWAKPELPIENPNFKARTDETTVPL